MLLRLCQQWLYVMGRSFLDNALEKISEFDLAGLATLQYLDLSSNYITMIEAGAFSSLVMLTTLYVSHGVCSSLVCLSLSQHH